MLQEPCVAVTQEELNSSTETMRESQKEKLCGNPYNIIITMGLQRLKKSIKVEYTL